MTAAHGNCIRHGYPAVLDRAMSDVFAAAGVTLTVRNAGMGGTSTLPYAWCLPAFLGDDADIVSWEFGMMEAGDGLWFQTELYIRQAQLLPHRPAVVLATELDPRLNGCSRREIDGVTTRLDGNRARVAKYYSNFTEVIGLATAYALCDVPDSTDAPYPLQHITGGGDKWHDKYRGPTDTPGRASWHPGWRVHQLRGLLLGHYYINCMVKAIKSIRNKLAMGSTLGVSTDRLGARILRLNVWCDCCS